MCENSNPQTQGQDAVVAMTRRLLNLQATLNNVVETFISGQPVSEWQVGQIERAVTDVRHQQRLTKGVLAHHPLEREQIAAEATGILDAVRLRSATNRVDLDGNPKTTH